MKKALVIRFSSLGDVILATSVIEPLYRKKYKVDFLTFKPFDQLFINDYRLNRVIALDKKDLKSVKQIKDLAKNLNHYDFIIDLHANFRTKLLSFFSKRPFIVYNKRSFKRRMLTNPFFKKFINLSDFNVLNAYQETLKELGIYISKTEKPKIILKDEEKKYIKSYTPENFIALGTGARYKNKMYPFFNKVSEILIQKGFNVVLLGSKEDLKIDKNIYPDKVIDLRGKLSIRESLAVLSYADLTISNDSAVAHMSRAVSTPVLMIYGATHPDFGFHPLKEEGDFIFKNLPCQPCDLHGKKSCRYGDTRCLKNITPEEVIGKAFSILEKS